MNSLIDLGITGTQNVMMEEIPLIILSVMLRILLFHDLIQQSLYDITLVVGSIGLFKNNNNLTEFTVTWEERYNLAF